LPDIERMTDASWHRRAFRQSHKGKVALLDAQVNASDVVRAGRL